MACPSYFALQNECKACACKLVEIRLTRICRIQRSPSENGAADPYFHLKNPVFRVPFVCMFSTYCDLMVLRLLRYILTNLGGACRATDGLKPSAFHQKRLLATLNSTVEAGREKRSLPTRHGDSAEAMCKTEELHFGSNAVLCVVS